MTRIVIPFTTYPRCYAEITGLNGKKRELIAVVNPAATDVVIPRVDALHLGYPGAYLDQPGAKDALTTSLGVTLSDYIEVCEFSLNEVRVGKISMRAVTAVAYDTPLESGIDVILGLSFLSRLKTTIDYEKKELIFEDFPLPPPEAPNESDKSI